LPLLLSLPTKILWGVFISPIRAPLPARLFYCYFNHLSHVDDKPSDKDYECMTIVSFPYLPLLGTKNSSQQRNLMTEFEYDENCIKQTAIPHKGKNKICLELTFHYKLDLCLTVHHQCR
jgi:hypothetical protein